MIKIYLLNLMVLVLVLPMELEQEHPMEQVLERHLVLVQEHQMALVLRLLIGLEHLEDL